MEYAPAAAKRRADRAHHRIGRDSLGACEHECLAACPGRITGGEQAPYEIVHIDELMFVSAAAEGEIVPALHAAKQLQEAHITGSIRFGDAHNASFHRPFEAAHDR